MDGGRFENRENKFFENEEVLIEEIKQGNAQAFKFLMKTHFEGLAEFAYQYVKSSHRAKDVVQDVFANIWERKNAWNPRSSVKMYLYKAVKNEALKKIRDEKTEKSYIQDYVKEQEDKKTYSQETLRLDVNNKFEQDVQQAIEALPERARMAYKLHRRDGLTYKEIAEIMDISHRTVESQIRRALQILRDKLSAYLTILVILILF